MIQEFTIETRGVDEEKIFQHRIYIYELVNATAQNETQQLYGDSPYAHNTIPLPHSGSLINGQNKTRTAR